MTFAPETQKLFDKCFDAAAKAETDWAFDYPGYFTHPVAGETNGFGHFISIDPETGEAVLDAGGEQNAVLYELEHNHVISRDASAASVAMVLDSIAEAWRVHVDELDDVEVRIGGGLSGEVCAHCARAEGGVVFSVKGHGSFGSLDCLVAWNEA